MLAGTVGFVVSFVAAGLALGLYLFVTRAAPARVATSRPIETPSATEPREPAAVEAVARRAHVEPPERAQPVAAAPAQPEPAVLEHDESWPPARAFTARCRAPGGGCDPNCTRLAGERCLDPCFIHTSECSRDCLNADGSCGWPPPDTE